jgi:hypothetical protein
MSSDLQRLQREMQRAIMTTADPPVFVHGGDAGDRRRRFGIYTSAYRARLQEALAHNFPIVHAHLGDAEFGSVASAYVDAHPSTHPSIRTFGNEFARWLGHHRPHAPWLHELAQLEWTLGSAFDAPDDTVLSADALASIEPAQWAQLRFHFARSVQRLTCRTNAPELYESPANAQGRRESQSTEWLIWRQQLTARYRPMTSTEALAFDALAGGETFGAMCASLLDWYSEEDAPLQAAACLKRWLADEVIVTLSLAEA